MEPAMSQATKVNARSGEYAGEIEDETRNGSWVVRLESGEYILVPRDQLRRESNGSASLLSDIDELRARHAMASLVLAEEELTVEKRERVRGSTFIRVTPHTDQRAVAVPLNEEHAEVRRVRVERFVDQAPPIRTEGDVVVVPVMEEVLVVEKRLMLREEIHITRKVATRIEEQVVPVRSERAEVFRKESPH
jgi:hypothetical protein